MKIAASTVASMIDIRSVIANSDTVEKTVLNSDVTKKTVNKDRNAPIGLFDSGIGGLSVYLHLAQQLPNERYVYYADTLHVPYGNRDSEDIKALTLAAVEWLYQQGCKLIVIACNSASAYALETARDYYPQLPIVGLVPALKPAVLASKSGHVAVLATKATLNGALLNDVITSIASPNATIVTKYFDPQLVPWVELGMPEDSETAQRLRQQLQVFAEDGVDQLVLGCTHYPFFKSFLLQEIAEHQLSMDVVDSGQAIAERVKQLLLANQLSALPKNSLDENALESNGTTMINTQLPLTFYATKYDQKLALLIRRLLGEETHLQYYVSSKY
ncbi:glutamate racemase [Psychrobacter sp. DAB_AL62B]|uniref:glutamate racemase n=1 Tax=Psychrobacter sp. DAB_AL62B TaxID=1028420 RepID=UPI0023816EA1|nr:glutamate racemase [Psychrobacter sp. DAB_AL62B]MDE4455917.1 glutamate racemase [Psychrobacter sp. DAB_AL62B]